MCFYSRKNQGKENEEKKKNFMAMPYETLILVNLPYKIDDFLYGKTYFFSFSSFAGFFLFLEDC